MCMTPCTLLVSFGVRYSGFLDVGADYHVHYVFVEASAAKPSEAPLVLCARPRARAHCPSHCIVRPACNWNTLADIQHAQQC